MWRRWNEQGSLGRLELWTRASVYVLLAAVPVLALILADRQHQVRVPGLAVFLLLSVAQAGVCVALLHAGLGRYLDAGLRPGRWLVASAAALTAAGVLAGAAAFPAFTQPPGTAFPVSMLVTMLFGGALILALTPLHTLRTLFTLVLVSAAVASGLTASVGRSGAGAHGQFLIGAFLVYTLIVGIGALTCRVSAWTLRIMSEVDRSRTAHARLSVAEERLRFARDLHDVLGRNLSLIAVQSELAAQLARQGDQDAAGHMLEVHQVAHESLREMRAVVRGYRTADLGTELAGAQDVLRSAGMSCRVIGDAAGLPPDVQAALGWVVREGTTNVIRHSNATACTIELHILDSPVAARVVTLSMDNDRVHALNAESGGSGLLGLGERLATLGGSITTGQSRNGHFRLEASLPACGGAAAAPGGAAAAPGAGQRGTGVTAETPAP
jgi:two-component system sensor histidine kinase DesK